MAKESALRPERLRRGDDAAGRPRFAPILALVLAGCVAACGFHLRGSANYQFESLYLASPPALPLTTELRRALENAGSAKIVDSPDKAQVVLDITNVRDDKQILSLSSGGKVAEYLLIKHVLFRVHDKEGNEWLPTTDVLIRRTYTYSDTETLAKEAEEARLVREMQTDAVQQIVRRLETARKPAD